MQAHEIITASILMITCLASWIFCFIIRSYLLSKPLGKQILLDKFLIELLKAYLLLVSVTNFFFYFMAIPWPFDAKLAQISFYIANFAINYWLIWLSTVVIVKYISIFHHHWLEVDKSDTEILYLIKIFNWILFLTLYCIEHLIICQIDSSAFYQFLHNRNNTPDGRRSIPITSTILVVIAVCSIVHLHVKMELTGMKSSTTKKMTKIQRNVVRLIVSIISSTIVYVMYALATVKLEDLFTRLTHGCIVPIFTAAVPPLLFILRNSKMRRYAFTLKTKAAEIITLFDMKP